MAGKTNSFNWEKAMALTSAEYAALVRDLFVTFYSTKQPDVALSAAFSVADQITEKCKDMVSSADSIANCCKTSI